MHTPAPPLDPRARLLFEIALIWTSALVILVTFADRHGFYATVILQFTVMFAILGLTRLLPYLLSRRAKRRSHASAL
jgi:hypothetical protein